MIKICFNDIFVKKKPEVKLPETPAEIRQMAKEMGVSVPALERLIGKRETNVLGLETINQAKAFLDLGELGKIDLQQLIFKKQAEWGRRLTYDIIAEESGTGQRTLVRYRNKQGKTHRLYFDTLDKLCLYFEVGVDDIVDTGGLLVFEADVIR